MPSLCPFSSSHQNSQSCKGDWRVLVTYWDTCTMVIRSQTLEKLNLSINHGVLIYKSSIAQPIELLKHSACKTYSSVEEGSCLLDS